MVDQNPLMQPKPGDIVKPDVKPADAPAPTPPPVETTTQIVSAPVEAPVMTEVAELTPTPTPPATTEVVPPAVPPPVEPIPTVTPSHRAKPLFAIILFVILLLVGALLYFLYFRDMGAPTPAPVEIRETTESTTTGRTTQEDTTSLQYLESAFGDLDDSSNELTEEMEAESQLNLGTSTNNSSEL